LLGTYYKKCKYVFENNSDKSEQFNYSIPTQCYASPSIAACHLRLVPELLTSNVFLQNSTRPRFRANAVLARNPHLLIRLSRLLRKHYLRRRLWIGAKEYSGCFDAHADHPENITARCRANTELNTRVTRGDKTQTVFVRIARDPIFVRVTARTWVNFLREDPPKRRSNPFALRSPSPPPRLAHPCLSRKIFVSVSLCLLGKFFSIELSTIVRRFVICNEEMDLDLWWIFIE